MLSIGIKVNTLAIERALQAAGNQAPYAQAVALTRTARDVQQAERGEMAKVFQNPTPYTLNALYLSAATKARLEARVWLKNAYGSKPHYLAPQIEGGDRPQKRFEARLRMLGYMRADERAVPGEAMPIDAYGNMSRGLIVKILSQLRTAVTAGDFSNASNSKRSRAKRAVAQYFVSQGTGSQRTGFGGLKGKRTAYEQHLPRGVWERRAHAWGTSVRPALLFVPRAHYSRRWDFYGLAQRVIADRYPIHAKQAIADALRTARLTK